MVRSPDFIKDRDTGERREVDVGIHIPRNGGATFIAIECRDRKAAQHVEWIEQLICKKQSIGADVLVAISSSRFYQSARIKALKHGVILACMNAKLPEDIGELAKSFFITFQFVAPRILAVDLQIPSLLAEDLDNYTYRHSLVDHDLSLNELAQVWSTPNLVRTIVKDVKDFSRSKFAKVELADINASVLAGAEEFPVIGAKITYELNYGEVQLPLRAVHELTALEGPPSEDALTFVFGTQGEAMSEVVVDGGSDTLRWDILGKYLLSEGKVLIGACLKANKPVSITTMRLDV